VTGAARRVVIVGASAAGVATAEALARANFAGEIVLVGAEPEIAHDRPPLSKQVLAGHWSPEQAALLPPARLDALTAQLRLGVRVAGLDTAGRKITLDDGELLDYDELVIATGVRPRELPGGHPEGVHVLRTMADALALRSDLTRPGAHLLVVGAGFLGLEVAATARKLGVEVTVVEPVPEPLASRLGAETARRLLELHRSHGVEIRTALAVDRFEVDEAGHLSGAKFSDDTTIACSVAVVAIGCVPNTDWLAGSGLELADGVVCDAMCRAADGVWAVGDVARWQHDGLGRAIRIEHRLNATEQAIAVAANIIGPGAPYEPTPYFWTDQYDVKVQVSGIVDPAADEEVETVLDGKGFVHTFRLSGRLVGVLGWNAAKAMMPYRRELRMRSGDAAAAGAGQPTN
jgi:NADPH-dependent 2,4-dienoyl-CoA reductase/sulfur reductase-like enzyme